MRSLIHVPGRADRESLLHNCYKITSVSCNIMVCIRPQLQLEIWTLSLLMLVAFDSLSHLNCGLLIRRAILDLL